MSGSLRILLSAFALFLFLSVSAFLLFSGWLWIDTAKHPPGHVGKITGIVVDSKNRPVAGATVEGHYDRGWAITMPPVPNAVTVASAVTGPDGRFELKSAKRIDEISVQGEHDPIMWAELDTIGQSGNVIELRSRPPWITLENPWKANLGSR